MSRAFNADINTCLSE